MARDVFQKRGHAVSTRDIADEVGVSQAVLFQRFGSKDELFFKALTPVAPEIDVLLGPYPSSDGLADVQAIAARLLAYMRSFTPTLLQVLAYSGGDGRRLRAWHARLPFPAIVSALSGRLQRLDDDGLVRCDDPHAAAVVLVATVHLLAMLDVMTTAGERDSHGADLVPMLAVLWKGLEPAARRRSARSKPRRPSA